MGRKSNREGEAAFYLLVAVVAILALMFYWKVFLLIAIIVLILFLFLRDTNQKPVSDAIIINDSKSTYIKNQKDFRQQAKQKGESFEEFVADHFRNLNYDVVEHGKMYGRKDQGIDLIATNDYETVLIQCKNWSASGRYAITHSHLKEFIGNTAVFLEKTPSFAQGQIRRLFVTSEEVLDKSAIGYLRNNEDIVEHRIIPML